jgi:hypothetical protein
MKRFLIRATAVILGLSIWGMANADDPNSRHFVPGRVADVNPDASRYLDHWRSEFDWNDSRLLDHWRFNRRDDFGPFNFWRFDYDKNDVRPFDLQRDDLRHFDPQLSTI